jgi:hypothetical protein
MRIDLKALTLGAIEGVWQASRYLLAAVITALAVATVPILTTAIVTIVVGICVVILSLMMLVSAMIGTADPPFVALLVAVALPIGFIVTVIVAFAAIAVGVALFVGILVLPISLLTEVVLRVDEVRSVPLRLASFILAGGLSGAVVGVVGVLLINSQAEVWVSVMVGVLMFLLVVLSVSLFGIILTSAGTTRRMLGKLVSRLRGQVSLRDGAGVLQGNGDQRQPAYR